MDDTQKELERLDRELAALEKAEQERNAAPAEPETKTSDPEPETAAQPEPQPAAVETQPLPSEQDNKTIITLMILASVLCLGIIGVLIYWVEAFLK